MKNNSFTQLVASKIDTPLGEMLALTSATHLYFLEFTDHKKFDSKIERFKQKAQVIIAEGQNHLTSKIQEELNSYFKGEITSFSIPLFLVGSPFQQRVWQSLQTIPYGQTCSYSQLAQDISMPSAKRAVARANGSNYMPIIIPCHRVINKNGALGGYSSGIERKKWLISFEKEKI